MKGQKLHFIVKWFGKYFAVDGFYTPEFGGSYMEPPEGDEIEIDKIMDRNGRDVTDKSEDFDPFYDAILDAAADIYWAAFDCPEPLVECETILGENNG
jgi:hypothetical protein